jgi:dimethylamine/trimethylamine dehydrogenase
MQNVQMLRGSRVTAGEVLEFGATRIIIATGARWRRDGVGRANSRPIRGFDAAHSVFTPDELLDGIPVRSPVVVFDDDHYYLGAVLAEKLRLDGLDVTLVTPADRVSAWTVNTLEQHAIQKRVLGLGIEVHVSRNIVEFDGSGAVLECTYTERQTTVPAASVVTVTSRHPTMNWRNP